MLFSNQPDIWELLAGLGIFLFGMYFLEGALKILVGRNFKKFLRNTTDNTFKSILGGLIITILLQSSSVVTLMLLAFVGSGIINLRAAVGIIFGANLGSTFTGWLFVLLGFTFDIDGFAFFFITLGSLVMLSFSRFEKLYNSASALLGFGFLFLGLQFMKSSMGAITESVDLTGIESLNQSLLFLIGLALTAIMHSSSAMMVIALSALSAGVISLESAAIMIIGSDLGTTVTVFFGALKGTPVKKQVALCHVLFNVVTAILALLILHPLLLFFNTVLSITDPLYMLVLFHSSFNLIGIVLLSFFIGKITRFLELRFAGKNHQVTRFIGTVPAKVPEAAIEALRREINWMIEQVFHLNLTAFNISAGRLFISESMKKEKSVFLRIDSYLDDYTKIKQDEGKIVEYYLQIQNENLTKDEVRLLNRYIHSVHHAMVSAKGLKGIVNNIKEFENSSNDAKRNLYIFLKDREAEFYLSLYATFSSTEKVSQSVKLEEHLKKTQEIYDHFLTQLYLEIKNKSLTDLEISTLLNVNREAYNANRALIFSIKDLLLESDAAEKFNNNHEEENSK